MPIDTAREVAEQLIDDGEVQHAFLGISGTDLTPEIADVLNLDIERGALVQEVVPGSPADEAGLEAGDGEVTIDGQPLRAGGDVIVAVDGEPIDEMDDVIAAVDDKRPGDELELTLLRGDEQRTVDGRARRAPRSRPGSDRRPRLPPCCGMKVKFCGITRTRGRARGRAPRRLGDRASTTSRRAARVAATRRSRLEIGAELRRQVEVVGVFVNPTLDEVVRAAEDESLTMVQLHGDEGPAFCREVARRTGCKVIKAIRVRSAADVRGAEAFRTDFHLFDAHRPARRAAPARASTGSCSPRDARTCR